MFFFFFFIKNFVSIYYLILKYLIMKTKLIIISIFLSITSFAQNNRSDGTVTGNFTGAIPTQQFSGQEIFRFRPGLVTQLDDGGSFTTETSQWFAIGRVGGTGTIFNQTFYGLRFQQPNRALLMGYTSSSPNNPIIQWGGNGLSVGNLEFRVSTSLGSVGAPANDVLVATMTKEGNTFFGIDQTALGATAKVNIRHSQALGLNIENRFNPISIPNSIGLKITAAAGSSSNIGADILTEAGTQQNTGLRLETKDGDLAIGVRSTAAALANGLSSSYGIYGETFGGSFFEAAIYGKTPTGVFGNKYAGFFDGKLFSTGGLSPSDAKLKDNVKVETNVLERLSKLRAVSYDYKKITELNLPLEAQHGFVAQELEAVFPELTKDISKPIFDKEGKIVSQFEFKSVNYTGLISLLTAGINELNEELKSLKQELADLKSNSSEAKIGGTNNTKGLVLEQNIPNPFTNQTMINYQFSETVSNGSIMVFDLNGRIVKEYPLNQNKGQITISASEIGKGLFIYSLVQNGQELLSKKMIIN
jgi:hypothetical protein